VQREEGVRRGRGRGADTSVAPGTEREGECAGVADTDRWYSPIRQSGRAWPAGLSWA
jgi:hypothetical protein